MKLSQADMCSLRMKQMMTEQMDMLIEQIMKEMTEKLIETEQKRDPTGLTFYIFSPGLEIFYP